MLPQNRLLYQGKMKWRDCWRCTECRYCYCANGWLKVMGKRSGTHGREKVLAWNLWRSWCCAHGKALHSALRGLGSAPGRDFPSDRNNYWGAKAGTASRALIDIWVLYRPQQKPLYFNLTAGNAWWEPISGSMFTSARSFFSFRSKSFLCRKCTVISACSHLCQLLCQHSWEYTVRTTYFGTLVY